MDATYLPACDRCGEETARIDLRWSRDCQGEIYRQVCGVCRELIAAVGYDGPWFVEDEVPSLVFLQRCDTCVHAQWQGGDWHPYGLGRTREPGGWLCGHEDPPEDEDQGHDYDCVLWAKREGPTVLRNLPN